MPALENVPLWWERDISHSSVERVIWPNTFHLAATMVEKFTLLINNLKINKEEIRRNYLKADCDSHENMLSRIQNQNADRFEAYEQEKSGN